MIDQKLYLQSTMEGVNGDQKHWGCYVTTIIKDTLTQGEKEFISSNNWFAKFLL